VRLAGATVPEANYVFLASNEVTLSKGQYFRLDRSGMAVKSNDSKVLTAGNFAVHAASEPAFSPRQDFLRQASREELGVRPSLSKGFAGDFPERLA